MIPVSSSNSNTGWKIHHKKYQYLTCLTSYEKLYKYYLIFPSLGSIPFLHIFAPWSPWLVALQPKSLHPCFAGDATSCHWNQRCQRRPKRTPIPESHGAFGFRMRCQFWWVVRSGLGRWDPFFDIKEQDLLANRFQTKGWDKCLRTTTMFWLISSVFKRTNSCSIMPSHKGTKAHHWKIGSPSICTPN